MKTRIQQLTEIVDAVMPQLSPDEQASAARYILRAIGGEGPELPDEQLSTLYALVKMMRDVREYEWKQNVVLRALNFTGDAYTLAPISKSYAEWLLNRTIDMGNVTLVPTQP